MKELINRWHAPTPNFWKKIQSIGIAIGGIGAMIAIPPFGLATLGSYMITIGSVTGVLSQLTKEDK
jgi:hypothetical protein